MYIVIHSSRTAVLYQYRWLKRKGKLVSIPCAIGAHCGNKDSMFDWVTKTSLSNGIAMKDVRVE